MSTTPIGRRSLLRGSLALGGLLGLDALFTATRTDAAQVGPNDKIKVTKIETFVLTNSWVFVKISTDAGITGWGEMLKDDAKACAAGALEVGDYLVGQDPPASCITGRRFTAAPSIAAVRSRPRSRAASIRRSGTSRARCYGVPVYKLLGGPTRDRIRVYGTVNAETGVNAMKVQLRGDAALARSSTTKARSSSTKWWSASRRCARSMGSGVDIGVEFHGAVQPPTAIGPDEGARAVPSLVLRGGRAGPERRRDGRARARRRTFRSRPASASSPSGASRRFSRSARPSILQPDVCYAGGITELKIIAGMAEAYYTPLAPHNPQGPCSLAASLQIAASIPNFLIQERGDNEYADLLAKPLPPVKNGHRPLLTDPGPRHHHRRGQAEGAGRRAAAVSAAVRPRRRFGGRLVETKANRRICLLFSKHYLLVSNPPVSSPGLL